MKIVKIGPHLLYRGDCLKIIDNITQEIHCCLIDPPYGISYATWDVLHKNTNASLGKGGNKRKRNGKPLNGWSQADKTIGKEYQHWVKQWATLLNNKLYPAASVVLFNSRRYLAFTQIAFERSGYYTQDLIAWIKPTAYFQAFRPIKNSNIRIGNLAPKYEPILWLKKRYKGTLKKQIELNNVGGLNTDTWHRLIGSYDNIIYAKPINHRYHANQKDIFSLTALLYLICRKHQTVLDPFMGSGSTGVACIKTGRKFIGIENDKQSFRIAVRRIKRAYKKRPR